MSLSLTRRQPAAHAGWRCLKHHPTLLTQPCPTHHPLAHPAYPPPTTQEDATEHVGEVLERVKPEYLRRAYKLQSWEDAEDFLAQVARNTGERCWA